MNLSDDCIGEIGESLDLPTLIFLSRKNRTIAQICKKRMEDTISKYSPG